MVDKIGKQLKHFMIIAYDLAISNNANQILVLARKDNRYYHLHKFDVATEKSISLGYLQFDMYLWDFD